MIIGLSSILGFSAGKSETSCEKDPMNFYPLMAIGQVMGEKKYRALTLPG